MLNVQQKEHMERDAHLKQDGFTRERKEEEGGRGQAKAHCYK